MDGVTSMIGGASLTARGVASLIGWNGWCDVVCGWLLSVRGQRESAFLALGYHFIVSLVHTRRSHEAK
jgi:hypothetical protein